MGRMIGKLSDERTCYVSSALLEIVSELTKCPPTIDEKGLLIKATYPLTGLEVYVRLPAYGLDAGSVSSLECAHDDIFTSIEDMAATSVANAIHRAFHGASNILDPHLASPVFTGFQ